MDPRHLDPFARALSGRLSRRAALRGVAGVGAATAFAASGRPPHAAWGQSAAATPVTDHPRLWLTADDLPRLRGWATEANPMWRDGLLVLAEELKADMDAGHVPQEDTGSAAWEEYPTENHAEIFAFMSLVHPDASAREDYARRARTLLMHVMNEAAKGPAADAPFRDPAFVAPPVIARDGGARASP